MHDRLVDDMSTAQKLQQTQEFDRVAASSSTNGSAANGKLSTQKDGKNCLVM